MILGEKIQKLRKENMLSQERLAEFIERGSVPRGFPEETMNKQKSYWYILGAITGFLVFAVSMTFVESREILVLTGIGGMVGMSFCILNLVGLIMK